MPSYHLGLSMRVRVSSATCSPSVRTRPSSTSDSRTRARKPEAGGAKLMVYGGESEMEAGGTKVTVPEGMGTSVEAQGPPSPPEKLLAAPQLVAPATGGQAACANPRFEWSSLAGAASYTLEVCRDATCATLVERAVGLEQHARRQAAVQHLVGQPGGVGVVPEALAELATQPLG